MKYTRSLNKVKLTLSMGQKAFADILASLTDIGADLALGSSGLVATLAGAGLMPVFEEVTLRMLGNRERQRVGAVATLIGIRLDELINAGSGIRADGFFLRSSLESERSAGQEIFEGVLLAAQREYEEGKLLYYANPFAHIAVDPSVSRPYAARLVNLSQQLSPQQLAMMSLAGNASEVAQLREDGFGGRSRRTRERQYPFWVRYISYMLWGW